MPTAWNCFWWSKGLHLNLFRNMEQFAMIWNTAIRSISVIEVLYLYPYESMKHLVYSQRELHHFVLSVFWKNIGRMIYGFINFSSHVCDNGPVLHGESVGRRFKASLCNRWSSVVTKPPSKCCVRCSACMHLNQLMFSSSLKRHVQVPVSEKKINRLFYFKNTNGH